MEGNIVFLLVPICLVVMFSSMLAVFISIGVWTYKDAKNRGLNAVLWTIIVLLIPNMLGLILYILVGRKEKLAVCPNCNGSIQVSSKYCNNCGSENSEVVINEYKGGKKIVKVIIGCVIVCVISFIALFITMMVGSFGYATEKTVVEEITENISEGSGYSTMLVEYSWGDEWRVSYGKSTQTFTKGVSINDKGPNKIFVDCSSESGKVQLEISQGEINDIIDISNTDGTMEIDLSKYETGKIKIKLKGSEAENVKFEARWE